jgi:hypothetical protein
LDM